MLLYQPILLVARYHGLNAVAYPRFTATLRRLGRSAPANLPPAITASADHVPVSDDDGAAGDVAADRHAPLAGHDAMISSHERPAARVYLSADVCAARGTDHVFISLDRIGIVLLAADVDGAARPTHGRGARLNRFDLL